MSPRMSRERVRRRDRTVQVTANQSAVSIISLSATRRDSVPREKTRPPVSWLRHGSARLAGGQASRYWCSSHGDSVARYSFQCARFSLR